MKTHLPIALRKALLAALIAVSSAAYNRAEAAAFDLLLPDPAIKTVEQGLATASTLISLTTHDGTIAFVDGGADWADIAHDKADFSSAGPLGATGAAKVTSVTLETAFDGTDNTIKTDAASVTVTAEQGIGGSGNKISTGTGNVSATTITGHDTEIATMGGSITTGVIAGHRVKLQVDGDGNITTGDITGNNTTLEVTGEGAISTGEITGTDTRVEAEQAVTIEADTNNLIRGASVVKSKQAGIDMTAATGGNQISDTDTRVEAQQAVTIEAGTNNLISDAAVVKSKQAGIDMTAATGGNQITGDGTKVAASGAVTIGAATNNLIEVGATVLSDTDNIGISADGGNQITGTDTRVEAQQAVTIEARTNNLISDAAVVKSKQAGIDMTAAIGGNQITGDGTKVAASGAVTIGAAANNLVDAGAAVLSDTDNVIISAAGGNFVQNAATVNAGGTGYIYLNGGTTATNVVRHAGTELTAGGNIDMSGAQNIISDSAKLDSGKNVNLVAAERNYVDKATILADGMIGALGVTNVVNQESQVRATAGITIHSTGSSADDGNLITGGSSVVSETDKVHILAGMSNEITGTDTRVEAQQAVKIEAGTNNLISDAAVVKSKQAGIDMTAATGGNQISGTDTRVEAQQAVKIEARTNNLISDAAVVKSKQAGIDMTAAIGGNQITGAGTKVAASGTVTIGAATDNLVEAGATVLSDTENISISADGGNQITGTDTRVEAQQAVTIEARTNNLISDAAVVKSKQAGIDMTAATGGNQITGAGTKVAASGTVTIGAAANNLVDAGAAVLSDTDNVIISAAGGNFVQKAATVNAGGTGYIYLNGGTTATNVVRHAGTELTAGGNIDMSGAQNIICNSAMLDSGKNVNLVAADADDAALAQNTIDGAVVKAAGSVALNGEANVISNSSEVDATSGSVAVVAKNAADAALAVNKVAGSIVKAGSGLTLVAGGSNVVDSSALDTTTGNIIMTAPGSNVVQNAATLTNNGTGYIALLGGTTATNVVRHARTALTAGGNIDMAGAKNTIYDAAKLKSGVNVNLVAADADDATLAQNTIDGAGVEAAGSVALKGEANVISNSSVVTETSGSVAVVAKNAADAALAVNKVAGSIVKAGSGLTLVAGGSNVVGSSALETTAGNIDMAGAKNTIYDAAKLESGANVNLVAADADDAALAQNTIDGAEVKAAGSVALKGEANAILADSSVKAEADVVMAGDTQNAVANSTVTADTGSITMGDVDGSVATVENVITSEAGKTATLTAGKNVTIAGDNIITATDKGSTSITATSGNVTIEDSNYIRNAAIEALGAEGDVSITTGTGDKITWIEDSSITGETVTIKGDITDRSTENLAVVKGSDTEIHSWRDDNGAGITLNDVSVVDTEKDYSNIKAHGDGDIVILNRVDVRNGTLAIESGPSNASGQGRIVVDDDNVLNMTKDSSLAGRLSGEGFINKSDGDSLLLDYDHTEFNGAIYANGAVGGPAGSVADPDNKGSWIEIADTHVVAGEKAGVGNAATIVLKNTDLVVSASEASIGTLDTTQDAERNEAGTSGTLDAAPGSYTADDNHRTDFAMVGSVLEVNMDSAGDVVNATDMKLSDATLIKLDADVAADGTASSDKIEAAGTIDVAARAGLNSTSTAAAPSTARVYIKHNDLAAEAAEGARTTIMQGTMVTDINEDVLYDVAASGNGTYQRELLDRNVHLENMDDRVDLVYSKNYRSCDKTPQMQQVANALKQISDTFHHHEGTLAASSNRLHNLIDAFDYTRSEGAAQRGLQSVAGAANVLPRLMMFDASRRHLENLREQILMPDCPDASGKAGTEPRSSNAWMTYTGAYDSLNGDAYLDDYTRTGHGIMAGIDHSVRCNLRLGLSLGYEESIGRAENARVDAETFFVDAYAAGVTGRFKHRASIGLATGSYDTERNVLVDAGYHTFVGKGEGSVDSLTVNFGYEISTDIALNDSSWLTPYAALNLSWHSTDDLRESGMGEAGLVSSYGNEWQTELIFGVSYKHQFSAVPNQAPAMFYANAAMHLELFNDRVVLKNRFIGSPVGWRAESMNRESLYFELGAGVAVPLTPSWTATAGGSVEFGSERSGVSGNVGVRYQF